MGTDAPAVPWLYGNCIEEALTSIISSPWTSSIEMIDRAIMLNWLRCGLKAGDLTKWLEYSAEAIRTTVEQVWLRIEQFSAKADGPKLVLRPRQEELLRLLRDRQSLTPREIRDGIGVSKQGAMDLLNRLLQAGIVRRIGTRKSGRYILS